MTTFSVIPAKPYRCGQMVRQLRREHRNALIVLGADMHRQLRTFFDGSSFRRACLIDGRLAFLGGVLGTNLSSAGIIWLAVSEDAAKRYPIAVVKIVKQQLSEVMQTKRLLVATTLVDDAASSRFIKHLGFLPHHEATSDGIRQTWMLRSADIIPFTARRAA